MLFANKKKTKSKNVNGTAKEYDINEVYVLKTYIVSNINDATGLGPRCITCYFLARKEEEKYYELFSEVEIKHEGSYFNVPVIEEVKPLTDYINDTCKKRHMDSRLLFDFLLDMNMNNIMEYIIDVERRDKKNGE